MLGFCSVSSLYLAVALLPLADASVLSFLSPIFVAALRCGRAGRRGGVGWGWMQRRSHGQQAPSRPVGPHSPEGLRFHPTALLPCMQCSPFLLGEHSSPGVLLGIPVAMVGVVLVAKPSFLFEGGGGIRCGRLPPVPAPRGAGLSCVRQRRMPGVVGAGVGGGLCEDHAAVCS